MGVQIDQARRDDAAGDIPHIGAAGIEPVADRGDLASGKGDIGHPVDLLGRVDDAAVAKHEFKRHFGFLILWFQTASERCRGRWIDQEIRRAPLSRSNRWMQWLGADTVNCAPRR